jgi:all-trans-8'-apo-beta-carotenal 15,15'-oxygenase
VKIPAPPGFVFHHLNAFEHPPSGQVVVDSIVYDDFPSIGPDGDFRQVDFDRVPAGRLQRCRLNPMTGQSRTEVLESRTCEFATVNPLRQGLETRHAWMAVTAQERGNAPLQAIEKLDLLSGERLIWSAAPRGFVSEPVMVPAPLSPEDSGQRRGWDGEASPQPAQSPPPLPQSREDAGWVLVPVWNAARDGSDLVILDAATLEEVAVLELPLAIPYGLHGSWVSA